jgi:beta-galactosidase
VRIVTVPTGQAEYSAFVAEGAQRILVTADADLSQEGAVLSVSRLVPLGTAAAPVVVGRPGIAADLSLTLPDAAVSAPITVRALGPGRALLTASDPTAALDDLWLDLAYTGDLVRLFDAGTGLLVGDDFSRGIPWRLRLGRFAGQLRGAGLQVRVEPVSSRVEVDNAEGILLDHAERPESEARIDELRFLQRVALAVPVAELLDGSL